MLDNKLGITNEIELSKEEERITKIMGVVSCKIFSPF